MKKIMYFILTFTLLCVFTACNNENKTTEDQTNNFAAYLESNEFTTEDIERVLENADNSNLLDNNLDDITISNMKLTVSGDEANTIYIWQDAKKIYISCSEAGFIYYLDLTAFTESLPNEEEENNLIASLDEYIKSAFEKEGISNMDLKTLLSYFKLTITDFELVTGATNKFKLKNEAVAKILLKMQGLNSTDPEYNEEYNEIVEDLKGFNIYFEFSKGHISTIEIKGQEDEEQIDLKINLLYSDKKLNDFEIKLSLKSEEEENLSFEYKKGLMNLEYKDDENNVIKVKLENDKVSLDYTATTYFENIKYSEQNIKFEMILGKVISVEGNITQSVIYDFENNLSETNTMTLTSKNVVVPESEKAIMEYADNILEIFGGLGGLM